MLRAILPGLLACALGASAARADNILYATAATTGEVTSYCVGDNGGLDPNPRQRIATRGRAPSRFTSVTLPGGTFLYVAENNQVEVFRVGDNGELTRRGSIPERPLRGMNSSDLTIATAPDGTPTLYIPQRQQDRIAAFPIDPTTGLALGGACTPGCSEAAACPSGQCAEGACTCAATADCLDGQSCVAGRCTKSCTIDDDCDTAAGQICSVGQAGASCVLGSIPSDWEDVEVANGLLYVTRSASRGEVLVYELGDDGNFADGTVVVNQQIRASVNETQCAARTIAGVEVNPCDQSDKAYTVDSARCTQGVVLTDIDGEPIVPDPTKRQIKMGETPPPLTARAQVDPYGIRRRLNGAAALILKDDLLYVSERFRRAVSVLQLCPAGGQPPQCPGDRVCSSGPSAGQACTSNAACAEKQGGETITHQCDGCTCPDDNQDGLPDVDDLCPAFGLSVDARVNDQGICTVRNRQLRGTSPARKRGRRTRNDIRYNAMVLAQGSERASILGSQFLDGRIDGYRLLEADEAVPAGGIPRDTTVRTSDNFRASPFQMFVFPPYPQVGQVVFVGGGEIDRVQGFRLNARGLPRESEPFAQTVRLRDTFPNAVTVVSIPGTCPVR
jgi:hypothetical protein